MNESKAKTDSPQWAKWRAAGAVGGLDRKSSVVIPVVKTPIQILEEMPTPTDLGGVFALFLANEARAMDEGISTPTESHKRLKAVFAAPEI